MIIDDVIKFAKASSVSNLSIKNNDEVITMYIYLALTELYRRFNLSIKVEVVQTNPHTAVYELRNKDVNMVLNVYDNNKKELVPASIAGDIDYDYKQINFRTFLVTNPKDEILMFVYKASPPMISKDDELDLPVDMLGALLDYVAYKAHSTINKDGTNEATGYYQKFDKACYELEQQGYKVNIGSGFVPIQDKGFV